MQHPIDTMLQFDANANAHANVDASVNGPSVERFAEYVTHLKQECIPVGCCVPTAAVAESMGGWGEGSWADPLLLADSPVSRPPCWTQTPPPAGQND